MHPDSSCGGSGGVASIESSLNDWLFLPETIVLAGDPDLDRKFRTTTRSALVWQKTEDEIPNLTPILTTDQ
jgi:hypothetical protein